MLDVPAMAALSSSISRKTALPSETFDRSPRIRFEQRSRFVLE
jgi:hypothetical protein